MDKPYIEKVRNLVDHMRAGRIQVPNFQRPFVWSDEQRLELLHSIRDGIPIGGILLWKTSAHELACYDHVGPHPMAPPPKLPEGLRQYLLDGHQRMSTLFGALQAVPEGWKPEPEAPDWRIVYDLRSREFRVLGERALRAWEMPASLLHNRDAHRKFVRNLAKALPEGEAEALEVEADDIATRFDEYEVPVIPLATDDLDVATRTFGRVISMGTPMDEADLVRALTWRPDFELRKKLDDVRAAMPEGWQELEDRAILNVCKGLFGMEVNKAAEERLARLIRERPGVIDDAAARVQRAVHLLGGLGVPRLELLPYQLQWVCLALILDHDPTGAQSVNLERWFWLSTDTAAFAGASSSQVSELVKSARACAGVRKGDDFPFPLRLRGRAPPTAATRFDFRAAGCRALAVRLARWQAPGVESGGGSGEVLLRERGRDAVLHLFPRADLTPEAFSSGANRVVARVEDLPALRAGLLDGTLPIEVARRHALCAPDADRLPESTSAARVVQDRVSVLDTRVWGELNQNFG